MVFLVICQKQYRTAVQKWKEKPCSPFEEIPASFLLPLAVPGLSTVLPWSEVRKNPDNESNGNKLSDKTKPIGGSNWFWELRKTIYFAQREAGCTLSYASIRTIRLFKHHLPGPWTNTKKDKGTWVKCFPNLPVIYWYCEEISEFFWNKNQTSEEEISDTSVGEF